MFYAKTNQDPNHPNAVQHYEFTLKRLRDAWVAADNRRSVASAREVPTAEWRYSGDDEGWEVLAKNRVERSPALSRYRSVIIDYGWTERDHFQWVATEHEKAIISWAKDIAERRED